MKVTRPRFREGIEWRKLTPVERGGKPWKYVLLRDVFIEVETGLRDHYDCHSGDRIYVVLLPHGIKLKKGYAWNGNTGAPDWIAMLLASLPHDGIYQFSGAMGFPRVVITRCWTDNLYRALSPRILGLLYRAGLAIGSWAFWGQRHDEEWVDCKPLHQPEPT